MPKERESDSRNTIPKLTNLEIAERWIAFGIATDLDEIYQKLTPEQEVQRQKNIAELQKSKAARGRTDSLSLSLSRTMAKKKSSHHD